MSTAVSLPEVLPDRVARQDTETSKRNIAVDAYRGLVMLLMMGEVLSFAAVYHAYPGSLFWRVLAYNQTHVEWSGMGLHDMIQPSFTFLVGVAMPYSIASRLRKGQGFPILLAHTLWRSLLLVALGIFLRSIDSPRTNFTFEDTLTQIGLGYTFAFLISFCRPRWQWTALQRHPHSDIGSPGRSIPRPALRSTTLPWVFRRTGITTSLALPLTGTRTAIWDRRSISGFSIFSLANDPLRYNGGGYLTLSFIPTLGTMLLGLFAGQWFRAEQPKIPIRKFLIAGALLIVGCLAFAFLWRVPDREAHLDPCVDAFQRWSLLLVPVSILVGDRRERPSPLGFSARGGWREFDGRLSARALV